jgi:NhaA family Na+:H+ antiporter
LFSFVGAGLGLCSLPTELKWKHIVGAGFLGGIGFTMSIFITLLAFDDAALINNTKIAVFIASAIAGILGFLWLRKSLPDQT